jgi:hypothetical protein
MIVRGKLIIIMLSLVLTLLVVFPLPSVFAGLPSVTDITWTDSEGNTILNVTINHDQATVPPSNHYINSIVVEIDGVPNTVSLTDNQTTQPFVAQYNMGQVTGTPTVRVRGHCNVHGNGSFSAPVQVPEFSVILLVIFALMSTLSLFFSRKNLFQKSLNKS